MLPGQPMTAWEEPCGVNIRIAHSDTGVEEEVSLGDAKAVFFVRSFTGKSAHEDLQFYDAEAPAPYLWTRIIFLDGEVMECMVENSEVFLLCPPSSRSPSIPKEIMWRCTSSRA